MSILRRLTVAGTALALTLLGLVLPTPALAEERSAFPGAIDLPTWIMKGREPIESDASPQDNWVVTGKVVTYLSGERAGATDDKGEDLVAGIHVFARYQANNGAWSPIFKTTTTSNETKSKTDRLSNYAIKMRDFVDYNGELGQFRPGEGHAQRLQVWINPKQVPGYRLTFSERTGGVIQGYSTRKDFNWTASQMMQWGFLSVGRNSTQVSQVNIGLIKVAESQEELLGNGVAIEPSLPSPPGATPAAKKRKTLQGYVRWENQTLNRGGGNPYVGRANIADYPANTPAGGYVVVAAVKDKNNRVEARCTTTSNLDPSEDNGKTPNWTIYFNNDVDVKQNMKFQVFKGSCEPNNVSLQPLPKRMAYWSPFPTAVDGWGTTLNGILGSANQGWTGTHWEDNVRVLLRPLQMQLLPHGESLGSSAGTQSFYGDKVQVDYSRLPLNTPLVAHLYTGTLNDNGSGTPIESKSFTAQGGQGSGSVTFDTELTGDTFQEYWVDVVPETVTEHPEWQVLASQSFLYKPIQLEINKGAANTPGTFTITKKAPADNLVKLTGCQAVSNTDTAAATDALPYDLKRESTGNGCTLSGTPEKSGVHSLWVKFTFTDKESKSHTSVQYLPWTVEPRLKPQIEPGTPDSEVSKYSPLEKFPAVGVPYSGLVSPFPDWQGRHFTYQVFDTEPDANSAAREPGTDGMVSLRNGNAESGLKFNPATGQVTGTTQEHKSAVFWVKATDEDGGVTPAVKYEIHPGSPLILQRAQLPTGSGGSVYQNTNGTPIVIWVSGGEPKASQLSVNGTNLSRNTYDNAEILGVYDGDNPDNSVNANNIGGVKCESQSNSGGGKFILCSGTPNVSKATTYYLQVKYTDKNGRTLDGSKYTLPQVKALTTLTGSEGWLKMTLLPKIVADTDPKPGVISADLPDGTKGLSYGPQNVKSYLSGGTGNFADYTFSAAGLPAGLTMDANGVITGKPLETTTQNGVNVTVYLRGKDGTAAERSSSLVTFQLRIKTDLKATTDTLSATAQGGTTYTSSEPLLDVSSTAGISGGVSPYSYKLQYRDSENDNWQDVTLSGGRYQVPNADTNHSPSGLLLDSNGKLVGATMGTADFPQLRVVVTDADMVSCTGGCSVNVGLNLSRTDTRQPTVAAGASITANVGETVTGFLPINDPSGTPTKFEITNQLNLPGVTLKVNETTGEYTLKATNRAEAGNSGSVFLDVTGANGVVGHVTLRVHVVDQRVPQTNNNNVAISLEQGIPVPATAKVTGAIDAASSPEIKCFVPANYTSANCPTAPQKLPGLAGVTLNPDGTLTGTPVKGDVGEHQVPLKALGVNGKWSAEFSVKITVSPSTLVFEPGIAPGGTKGQAYEWTFNPATGAEGLTKTYKVYLGNQRVNGCSVDTSGTKPKLTCPDGALTNGETYTLRVSAGTGTAAVSIDRVFTPEIYPPLKFANFTLPSAAVGAVYQQEDGSTFRFTATGGSGSYGFGFATGSGHTQPTAPHSCTGWALYTTENKDSGLCLERDGRVTGTPKEAGTIDLSKLEVTDSAQHRAGLPEGATAQLVIHPLLQLTNMCVKPESGPDKHDNYKCKGEKNQPVGTNGKLKIATVSGGATPYRNLRVKGLDAYNDGVTDPAQQLKADWCDGAPTTKAGEDICLTGTWPKTMAPGSSLNIYVTGAAGRTVTVEAFIPVATDLKFIDNPRGVPGGVTLKQTSGNARPENIDQSTWTKVSSKIDGDLPTIGISLDKDAVKDGNKVDIPSLVTGGVGSYAYRTLPCDNTDDQGNCALGDTGLFLNKSTGELFGTPKPGASAAVVVSVTDSDSPAQTKKANLVFSIADTRKPKVTATTINAEVGKNVSQVIPVSDGSGQYESVTPTGKPDWMTLTLANNVLTVTVKPGPGHVTSTAGTFSVKVTDKNGNVSEPATITYTVVDNRVPNLSSLKPNENLTGTEGKSVDGWTELPKGTTKYGPKIKEWKVEGLPQGVEFDSATGTLSSNKIASGESGTYPITITATAENGKTTTIVKNLVVTPSTLKVAEHDAENLNKDRNLNADPPAIIATVSGGAGLYQLVSVTGLPSGLSAEHDGNGNIVLKGTIPDEYNDYSVTITVRDKDGVQRTLTRTLRIGEGLSVAKTTMPTATVGGRSYGPYCLGVSGGTTPYNISGITDLPTGMTLNVSNNDVCLSGVPTTGAGSVAKVTFTLTDSSSPQSGKKQVEVKIPVNKKFTAKEPNPNSHSFYAGSEIIAFTPTEGSGDSCYGLDTSGGCQSATFTYAASGLPAGLSINPQTGVISGTPTELVKNNREISVTVASSAPGSDPITKQFQITVASAFSNLENHFNVPPSATTPALDENGTVETDNPSNQVLPVPKIEKNGKVIATGKYSIKGVDPDSQGNYPLGDTGLALTPDGKLVGTLKPGQPGTQGTNGTFGLGSYDVVLQDDAGGDQIGPKTVAFTVKDTRTPQITVNSATVEVGQAADIRIGVTGGSGQIDKVELTGCKQTNTNVKAEGATIKVSAGAFTEGGKMECQVKVTDHNGLTKTEQFTIKVNDSRQPKFNTDERERYAWQGLDFTNVTLDSSGVKGIPVMTWLVDPSKDSTAAPLQSVKIAGLPKQFKVTSQHGTVTEKSGSYTCSNPADCTIVDYAAKDVSGVTDFTLTITADIKTPSNPTGLTASKSIPLRVFASPLQLNTSTPTGMIRATNGSYTSTVGTVDYLGGTITPTTSAGQDFLKSPSAWNETYALDNANYTIEKVTAYKRDGKSENVGVDNLTLKATPATAAAMPHGDQSKMAKTLTLSSTNTGAIPEGTTSLAVELKVTDGHGIVRSATVNIPVVQKLEWAGPPFNRQGDPVTLDNGVQGAPYPAYYAEAKGGDGSLSTSLAKADDVINNAVEADAKAKFLGGGKYKGIDPVYCDAQGTIKPDTRPKCFPIPGLGGDTSGSSPTNPLSANHQGLFMLSNGKLSGSIPENVTAGTYSAQVLVIDGSGQLIKKTFSITVEQKLTLTIDGNQLPKGKRGICYGSNVKVDLDAGEKCPAVGNGSGVKVGTYGGPDGLTAKCELIPPINGLAVTCTGGTVTISGAPTQTYDGNATVKVTLTDGAGQSVEKTVPLLIETDMIFKGNSTPGTGTDVKVETQTDGTQKIQVDTAADGKKFPNMKLDIEGGVGPYTYYVENSDGSAVSPVPCPAGVTTQTSNGKPIVCYPIGTTGLVLDSEGNVHGTPIPGGSADGKFVVADSDTTSRTKKAAITVNIADKRPPQVYDLPLNTTVGASTLGSAQLAKQDPQNPGVDTSAQAKAKWSNEQKTAAGLAGFHDSKPNGLGDVAGCSVTGPMPGWLKMSKDGVISLANVSAVPVGAAGKTLTFCVWYVGLNGVNAPKPAVVSVKVTDQRRVTIDSGNSDTTDAKIGEKLADSNNPKPLIGTTIPADLFDYGTNHGSVTVAKLNPDGTECSGNGCKFTSTGTSFTDESIDGLKVTGLNCTGTGDTRSCSIAVSGTPTPSAAGDHQLSYRLTLPNGQTQIISHTLHIPPYDLALSVEPMNPAVVGLDYLQMSKSVLAMGGSGSYWFQLWDPKHPVDNASDPNNTAKVGDMSLVTTDNQVKLQWTPTAADLAQAQNGNIPVTITVWDKTHCGINNLNPGQPGPTDCLYQVTKTVNIPLHAAPVTTDITVPEVTEGTSASSSPVYTGSGKAELSGTIAPGNEHLFTFDPNSGVVTLKDTARPGTYTAVIRVTLPGVAIPFYRNVTFTVKEKPVPEPTNPTPIPTTTPEPRPGVAPISPSTGITYPVRDLDTLVVRHGGNDRIDTSLAVLDFFSAKSSTPTEANNLTVAYADYAGKVSLPWSDTAVLVRDDDYPDALVAGPLAANYNAPILMTPTKQVPRRVVDALRTHGFTKVILVGNPGAISAGAASQLQNAGFQVQRLGGQDRYRTAGAVADHLLAARGRDKSDVYLATGVDYPDALSASSAAIKNVGVVLLTPRRTVDGTSQGWMNSAKAAKVVAVGGPAVAAAERSVHLDEKQVGVDRYETAEKVASAYFPPNPGRIAVATGKDFPDATLAASLTARTGSPLVLTRPDTLTKPTTQFLTRNRASVRKVDVVGGKAAVTEKVRGEIYSALR